MAPEQLRGQAHAIGPWTDLYALGCIAYRLISGHKPRTSGPRSRRCLLPLERPPRPLPLRHDVPSAVIDFVVQLLEQDFEHRPGPSRQVQRAWREFRPIEACPSEALELLRQGPPGHGSERTTRVDRPSKRMLFPTIAALAGW